MIEQTEFLFDKQEAVGDYIVLQFQESIGPVGNRLWRHVLLVLNLTMKIPLRIQECTLFQSEVQHHSERRTVAARFKYYIDELSKVCKQPASDPRVTCPVCGAHMRQLDGRFGIFYACTGEGCPVTVNATGKLSAKTRALIQLNKGDSKRDQLIGKGTITIRARDIDLD